MTTVLYNNTAQKLNYGEVSFSNIHLLLLSNQLPLACTDKNYSPLLYPYS